MFDARAFQQSFSAVEERGRSELFITKSPFSYATYISLHGNGIMRESNFTWHILQVSIRSIRALHIYSIPLHSLRQCFQCLQKGRLYLSRGRFMTTQQVQTAASPWTFKNDEQKTWNMYKLPLITVGLSSLHQLRLHLFIILMHGKFFR